MNETAAKPQRQEQKLRLLGLASLFFALSGWILRIVSTTGQISETAFADYFRWGIPACWLIALTLGWIALVRIKQERLARKHRYSALVGVWISAIPLVLFVISFFIWPGFPFPRQRPFSECDPNKVIALIENSFDFHLPDNISSAKAAETRTSWLEHNYMFVLNFTTDEEGWEQFHKSFPKIKDHDTKYIELDDREYIHDMYDFMDYDTNEYEPRIEPFWGWPKWFKAKIRKGKYFSGYLNSKDGSLQIDTLCIDLADPENVVIYIAGWGPYDPSYGLD